MSIVIKKRVSLDFLGEEYKEVVPKLNSVTDAVENIDYILKLLQDKFISGKFPVDNELTDLTAKDLGSLDEYTLAECLRYITGQIIDPKSSGQ